MMKTNIKLKVTHDEREEFCRVKLDGNKFPYIVIDNEKIVLNDVKFPRTITTVYGLMSLYVEMISGQEELKEVLNNPDLTVDKISIQQRMRLG